MRNVPYPLRKFGFIAAPRFGLFGIVIIAVVWATAISSRAAEVPSVWFSPLSRKNDAEFVQTVKKLQLTREIARSFVQEKKIAALKRPLISKGTIVLSKQGVCLATRSPFVSAVKITRDGIGQKVGNQKATVKKSSDHFEIKHTARILMALFTADKVELTNEFSVYYQRVEGVFQIGLKPKDKILSKIISNIVIEGSGDIRRITIREANGDSTVIRITDDAPLQQVTLETCIR
ncbi:MAG: outer membrane lipoprotein carrier protein LolA [Deltaproteobacteria bacterium]|nr:outer membrane lipoprotein carrier protein LolA [Deltaproteobacteria bacterium]MBN2673284.1 outer membrane lipoprotein carrier protein LolA [Deltaproteobacteria bacterium]